MTVLLEEVLPFINHKRFCRVGPQTKCDCGMLQLRERVRNHVAALPAPSTAPDLTSYDTQEARARAILKADAHSRAAFSAEMHDEEGRVFVGTAVSAMLTFAKVTTDEDALYSRWVSGDDTLDLTDELHIRFQARSNREVRSRVICSQVEGLTSGEGKTHNIKCWPDVFEEMRAGRKTAEFRYNDRGYAVGDMLLIREWDTATAAYTHREITRQITHVLDGGFGMPAGYVMLSLAASPSQPTNASVREGGE